MGAFDKLKKRFRIASKAEKEKAKTDKLARGMAELIIKEILPKARKVTKKNAKKEKERKEKMWRKWLGRHN